jgi:hypothetical protein
MYFILYFLSYMIGGPGVEVRGGSGGNRTYPETIEGWGLAGGGIGRGIIPRRRGDGVGK